MGSSSHGAPPPQPPPRLLSPSSTPQEETRCLLSGGIGKLLKGRTGTRSPLQGPWCPVTMERILNLSSERTSENVAMRGFLFGGGGGGGWGWAPLDGCTQLAHLVLFMRRTMTTMSSALRFFAARVYCKSLPRHSS